MADQRPAFRFRLPWLQAAPPPPRPTIAPRPPLQATPSVPTPFQRTTQTQVPSQQPTSTATPTPAPSQPISTTTPTPTPTPQKVDTETPTQPPQIKEAQAPIESITTNAVPSSTTPQTDENGAPRPPSVATITPTPQAPFPEPQASRTKSHPSSPSLITSQSRVPSQPASPSRLTTQSRSSQPSSTPSPAASQSQATSPLSSPPRSGAPNSPTPRTPPRPQSRIASRSAGQMPSSSPSRKAAQGQPTTAILTQSTSPPKREPRLSLQNFQPSSSSTENPPYQLEQETKSAVPEQQSLERFLPKEETKSGNVYVSQEKPPVETSTEPSEVARHPLEEFGKRKTSTFGPTRDPQTSALAQKSDARNKSSEPENFPEETKEVKEIWKEIKEKTNEEARDKDDYYLSRSVPGMAGETKDHPSFTYQSQQQQQKLATANGVHVPLQKEIRDNISKLVRKVSGGDPKHSVTDRPVSVITLAGENRGATMQLGTDSMKKGGAVPIQRGYKLNPDKSAEIMTDGEGSSKVKSEDAQDTEDQAEEEFINSNVQGINNSIVFNSSITERNPGVHLVHSRFPTKVKKTSTAETELPDTEKRAFSMSHAQKVTHQPPMVRRRRLQGLFMESSDSDPENSTKPRRHGCRVGCKEKSEETKVDIF